MLGSIAAASPSTFNGWQFNLQLYKNANIYLQVLVNKIMSL